ncbi:MAG: SHOCT domain-containing protein [Gemmataceae bacterium]|nr:SHOCT domain-containing protein [Gemmataceae bacterium]
MRVGCGLFMLLIAATLGWGAFNWGHNASKATGVASWLTNEKQTSENFAVRYGVGAAIFGVLALVVLASGSSTPPAQHSGPVQQQRRDPGPSNAEARLRNLRDLLDKRLISEEEYSRRRKAILDEV